MISFIIIGKNEGWKLLKCIESIVNLIKGDKKNTYEIIYVDSNSTDDSIKNVKGFSQFRIFKLTGAVNAAIARNIGAKEAMGDIFFFMDGDMEINEISFFEIFDSRMKLKYKFLSGDFQNIYYENSTSTVGLSTEMYHKNEKIKIEFTTGGLFAITKDTWKLVNGMRNVFKRSQDMDLGLRLSKKGIYMHRLPINLAKHHTVSYHSKTRLWANLRYETHLYGRSLLYRKNIFNINTLKLMLKQDYSLVVLIFLILGSLLFRRPEVMALYLLILILRSISKNNLKYIIYFLLRDMKVLFGFIFFYKKNKSISYISVV